MKSVLDNVFLFEDTANVYVIRNGREAVLVDFGSGDVLQHLSDIGVERVTDVLITHHHRDQCQGLQRAVDAGIRVWVPHQEQDLVQNVDAHWQSREIYNNYNNRQDRFSLLNSIAIDGTLRDYESRQFAGMTFTVIPTPGHTTGSISLWAEVDGKRVTFTGDLIAGPGKVWSLSTTQWAYNGAGGVAMCILSLLDLRDRQPDLLLPSHGTPMADPTQAIDLTIKRLWQLLQLRGEHKPLLDFRARPYEEVTPHVLKNRTSVSNSYALVSESKKALVIDFGYDFFVGAAGSDRASRRPWLYSIPALKAQYGIERIDAVVPTHFHDDHVAGLNLLRQVEGAQVWAASLFADILENPARYDLPCLWYDPIKVDHRLPLEIPIRWEEYTLTLHAIPGHTRYAVAIEFEADGQKFLASGDQYQGATQSEFNYVYRNHFDASDYVRSAALYARAQPDIILSGHWDPFRVTPEYLERIRVMGDAMERLHRELLPDAPEMGEEGFLAHIFPYQANAREGEPIDYQVEVCNPFGHAVEALVQMVLPPRWAIINGTTTADGNAVSVRLNPNATEPVQFRVTPPAGFDARRERVAVDVTIDGVHFGQQAEALVSADLKRKPAR